MPGPLVHLNALRALEVSARLGSFARAAEELGVTPAAVGQQVRLLEDYLGRPLFRRTPTGLRATAVAARALADLRGGFERLESGFGLLKEPGNRSRLAVSVAPNFAWKWLAPRLQCLYAQCPRIDLRMDTSMGLADVAGGDFDLAIRYSVEEDSGLKSTVLLEEYGLPVCTPDLLKGLRAPLGSGDLPSLPLLHVDDEDSPPGCLDWPAWGSRFGLDESELRHGAGYPQTAMALQAGLDGQGVVLCGLALAMDDLHAGRLIAPLGPASAVKTNYAYRLVSAANRDCADIQKIFMLWIKGEADKTRNLMSRFLVGS